jgi:hypothetical protein
MGNNTTQPVVESKAAEDVSCLFCFTETNKTDGTKRRGVAVRPAKSNDSDDMLELGSRITIVTLAIAKSPEDARNTDFEIVVCLTGPEGCFRAFQEWSTNQGKVPGPSAPILYQGPGHWLVVMKQLTDNGQAINQLVELPPSPPRTTAKSAADLRVITEMGVPRSLFVTAITGPEAKLKAVIKHLSTPDTCASVVVATAPLESKNAESV